MQHQQMTQSRDDERAAKVQALYDLQDESDKRHQVESDYSDLSAEKQKVSNAQRALLYPCSPSVHLQTRGVVSILHL